MREQVPPMCNDRPYVRQNRKYGESPYIYFICPDKVKDSVIEAPCTGSVHVGTTEVRCPCACHTDSGDKPRPTWWERPEGVPVEAKGAQT
jgi:hypothetical protein